MLTCASPVRSGNRQAICSLSSHPRASVVHSESSRKASGSSCSPIFVRVTRGKHADSRAGALAGVIKRRSTWWSSCGACSRASNYCSCSILIATSVWCLFCWVEMTAWTSSVNGEYSIATVLVQHPRFWGGHNRQVDSGSLMVLFKATTEPKQTCFSEYLK